MTGAREAPRGASTDAVAGEVTELLRQLIRNACVNDGTAESGHESRNADAVAAALGGAGLDLQRFEPTPGRASLVARIEGSDPAAPSLLLMGHTDVVPATGGDWCHPPFDGELIGGEVWGRGAVDMLGTTAAMAVAVRRLARSGFRPRGTLVYLAVADEEALGSHGAGWLVEHAPDAVRADFVVTEFGGMPLPIGPEEEPRLPVMVGEKGAQWMRLVVRGTAGHASQPFRTDNAVATAAEAVRRLEAMRPPARVSELWRRFVMAAGLPPEAAEALLEPAGIERYLAEERDDALARTVHACTHTTLAPTILQGGVKTNVIPDAAEVQLDIRVLPGETGPEVTAMVCEALGELAEPHGGEPPRVVPEVDASEEATLSPIDTPLWDALERQTHRLVPTARPVPMLLPAATDARFFRRLGATAYGYGLFSEAIPFGDFMGMFHGVDERVDQESLRLSAELWRGLAEDLLRDGPAARA